MDGRAEPHLRIPAESNRRDPSGHFHHIRIVILGILFDCRRQHPQNPCDAVLLHHILRIYAGHFDGKRFQLVALGKLFLPILGWNGGQLLHKLLVKHPSFLLWSQPESIEHPMTFPIADAFYRA